jgi:hypothetical protein
MTTGQLSRSKGGQMGCSLQRGNPGLAFLLFLWKIPPFVVGQVSDRVCAFSKGFQGLVFSGLLRPFI